MPVWVWVLIGLVTALGIFLYRHLVWIPRHSPLNQLDELPHLREMVERLASSHDRVSLEEEDWRFVLTVSPQLGRRPRELWEYRVRRGHHFVRGQEREGEVVVWEVTVNKKASEWIAAGFDHSGDEIVEHRFGTDTPRSNYYAHTLPELDQIALQLSSEVQEWVQGLVEDAARADTRLTGFQIACEERIATEISLPLSNRTLLDDGEGGVMIRANLRSATVWIYPEEAQWQLGNTPGYFEWPDFKDKEELIDAFVADLNEIAATDNVPRRSKRR